MVRELHDYLWLRQLEYFLLYNLTTDPSGKNGYSIQGHRRKWRICFTAPNRSSSTFNITIESIEANGDWNKESLSNDCRKQYLYHSHSEEDSPYQKRWEWPDHWIMLSDIAEAVAIDLGIILLGMRRIYAAPRHYYLPETHNTVMAIEFETLWTK